MSTIETKHLSTLIERHQERRQPGRRRRRARARQLLRTPLAALPPVEARQLHLHLRTEAKARREGHHQRQALLAHPGLAKTNLQVTTAEAGGMELDTPFMEKAQSAEEGTLGILRACADPEAGDFYGPEGWTGFANKLPPEELLLDPEYIRINWDGCEAAVGAFAL